MIGVVLAVAACAFAGGYFVQFSTAVEDWRATWNNRELTAWSDYGAVEGRRFRRIPALIRGKFYGAITCGTCFGWHVAWVALGVQALLAAWSDSGALVSIPEAPVVWGAACGLHTALFKLATRSDLLKEE